MDPNDEMKKTIQDLKAELGALKQKSPATQYALQPQSQYAAAGAPQMQQYEPRNNIFRDAPSAMELVAKAFTQMYQEGTKYFNAMTNALREMRGLYAGQQLQPAYAGAQQYGKGATAPAAYKGAGKR